MNNNKQRTDWGSVLVFFIAFLVLTGFMPSVGLATFVICALAACCKTDAPAPKLTPKEEREREERFQAALKAKEEASKPFWDQYEKERLAIANMKVDLNHKPINLD